MFVVYLPLIEGNRVQCSQNIRDSWLHGTRYRETTVDSQPRKAYGRMSLEHDRDVAIDSGMWRYVVAYATGFWPRPWQHHMRAFRVGQSLASASIHLRRRVICLMQFICVD
jgi:hypothetical protein